METTVSIAAVGYLRVSTAAQSASGLGLEAQHHAIQTACEHRGWDLVEVCEDAGLSGKTLKRPGLQTAIAAVESGRAGVLIVAKLDRLSRSLIDFAGIMERARDRGWRVVALDLGVDTSTPQGELLANTLATTAQFERRLIGVRTKEALEVKKSQGVRLGRPRVVDDAVVERIAELRRDGLSYAAIGRELDQARIPTAHGGVRWHPNTVRQVHLSQAPSPPLHGG
jgi:DNA invertase Pin-like site-specific DNA recombinase